MREFTEGFVDSVLIIVSFLALMYIMGYGIYVKTVPQQVTYCTWVVINSEDSVDSSKPMKVFEVDEHLLAMIEC